MKTNQVFLVAALCCVTGVHGQETVSYASYGGAYQEGVRKAILNQLPEAHGMTVVDYTLSAGMMDIRTKVRANAVDIDVAELYGGFCDLAMREGLTVPLDYSKIPNASGVPAHLRRSHWVGFTAYTTVLAYNTRVYGKNPPRNWRDFFDTKNFPGTRAVSAQSPATNMQIALLADGVEKAQIYPVDMERAMAQWRALKPDVTVLWASGAQATQLAMAEEIDMIAIWAARIDAAIAEGAPYAYALDDAVMDVECLVVPKNSPNPDGAMRLINHLLDPVYQARLPEHIPYGPMNQDAFKRGLIAPAAAARIVTSTENLTKQLITDGAWWADHEVRAHTLWDTTMLR